MTNLGRAVLAIRFHTETRTRETSLLLLQSFRPSFPSLAWPTKCPAQASSQSHSPW